MVEPYDGTERLLSLPTLMRGYRFERAYDAPQGGNTHTEEFVEVVGVDPEVIEALQQR